jgi:hypothetical protein
MAPTGGVRGARVLAQLNSTSGIDAANIALGIIGTFAIVVLAARALAAFADERYGKMVTLIIAAIPVIGFAYFPDLTVNILKGLFTAFAGGGNAAGGGT